MPNDLSGADLILTGEAARLLAVSGETIRQWVRLGRLNALTIANGMRLFDRREVLRLVEERAKEAR